MILSRSADYGLRATIYLAGLPAGAIVSGSALAGATRVAGPFLLKIMRLLVRSRLVNAQRGSGGGFQLALDPEQISMLRVIEAIDGPHQGGPCSVEGSPCDRIDWRGVHQVLAEAESYTHAILKGTSVAKLRRESEARRGFLQARDAPVQVHLPGT